MPWPFRLPLLGYTSIRLVAENVLSALAGLIITVIKIIGDRGLNHDRT